MRVDAEFARRVAEGQRRLVEHLAEPIERDNAHRVLGHRHDAARTLRWRTTVAFELALTRSKHGDGRSLAYLFGREGGGMRQRLIRQRCHLARAIEIDQSIETNERMRRRDETQMRSLNKATHTKHDIEATYLVARLPVVTEPGARRQREQRRLAILHARARAPIVDANGAYSNAVNENRRGKTIR